MLSYAAISEPLIALLGYLYMALTRIFPAAPADD